MIRSFLVGTLLVGLAGGLVFGAINRTSIKSNAEISRVDGNLGLREGNYGMSKNEQAGIGRSQRNLPIEEHGYQNGLMQNQQPLSKSGQEFRGGKGQGQNSLTMSGGAGQTALGRGQRGSSGSGQGTGGNSSGKSNVPNPQADAGEWETVQGTVTGFDAAALILRLPDGSQVIVEGRALAYALEQGFSTSAGNTLQIEGFHEDGEYKAASISDITAGTKIVLRDQGGRPSWAGNGWGTGSSEG